MRDIHSLQIRKIFRANFGSKRYNLYWNIVGTSRRIKALVGAVEKVGRISSSAAISEAVTRRGCDHHCFSVLGILHEIYFWFIYGLMSSVLIKSKIFRLCFPPPKFTKNDAFETNIFHYASRKKEELGIKSQLEHFQLIAEIPQLIVVIPQ